MGRVTSDRNLSPISPRPSLTVTTRELRFDLTSHTFLSSKARTSVTGLIQPPSKWHRQRVRPSRNGWGVNVTTNLYSAQRLQINVAISPVSNMLQGVLFKLVKGKGKGKGKAIPVQTWTDPRGSRSLRLPEFLDNQQMKVVKLSALSNGRLYPLGTHSFWMLGVP
jgi:hypothetical protein